ncbi:hypothetical protein ID866_4644 [Astraeus odoratus]|nr:hypothetical protein ID866_4644 [Astraeus odoratus]
MLAADIVPSLLKLVKPYDDFVAPAAVDVLCMLLSEVSVRLALTENGKVSLFMDMLVKPSDEVRHAGAKALTAFARHDAKMLMQGGYIKKLVKDVQYSRADHRAGAILALVALDAEVPAPVCEALEEAGTINALVTQLGNKSRALAAASALAQLMTIDHVKKTAIESHAAAYICKMLRRRWFDGNDNEDGIGVLQRVLSIAPLRAAILKESSVDLILDMLKEENSDVVYAGLQYMREIIKHDDGRKAFYRPPTIDPLLNALRCPQKPLQRCSIAILQKLYNYKRSTVESLCPRILNGLLSMIKCRRGSELLGTTTALRVLSSDGWCSSFLSMRRLLMSGVIETVRSAVVMHRDFWDLSHAYYNRLMVNCGKKGPNFREVYQAIGGLITCVQEGISQRHQDDSQWLEPQTPLEPTAVF